VGDLGLGAVGGEQRAGLHADLFEGLAVARTAGVAAVGSWSHAAMLPDKPDEGHQNKKAPKKVVDRWEPRPPLGAR
jgi:hypothetical protein